MSHEATRSRASELLSLHHAEKLLELVNVWDVISAKVVADVPGTTALATASHSIRTASPALSAEQIVEREIRLVLLRVRVGEPEQLRGGQDRVARRDLHHLR